MPTINPDAILEKVRTELIPEQMRAKPVAEAAVEIAQQRPQLAVIRGGADPRTVAQAIGSHELDMDRVSKLLEDPFA